MAESGIHVQDVYSFTTTPDDEYLYRVAAEAKPSVNFILATDNHEGTKFTTLLVRRNTLREVADKYPELFLAGKTLAEWTFHDIEELLNGNKEEWLLTTNLHQDTNKAQEVVRQQINAINNKLLGRVVKVTVESF
jgi:hypothetical protein